MMKNGRKEKSIEAMQIEARLKREKAVRDDIEEFLKKSDIKGMVFEDIIEDYMFHWNLKQDLQEDIKKNGVKNEYQNGKEQYGERMNPSIDKLKNVEFEMRKIRAEIGYTVSAKTEEEVDEL